MQRGNLTSCCTLLASVLLLVLLLTPSSTAFSPPQCSTTTPKTLQSSAAIRHSTIVRNSMAGGDDAVGTNHTVDSSKNANSGEINRDMMVPIPKFSKVKWKKKRYLMMQDVKNHIQQNHPQAPKKAEDMVRRMLRLYEKSGGDLDFRPTLPAYNLWIHALAKSKLDNAGVLAEQVMEKMRRDNIQPNVITYTSVMDAHARTQNPEQAQDLLFRLLDEAISVDMSSVTCDTILNAWAQQGTEESARRAQLILYRLEEWQRNDIRPTKISYATVMNAWAKVGTTEAAEQAEALLLRMLKPKDDSTAIRPDTVVFNVAINAWATSKDIMAGKKALDLLEQMKRLAKEEGYDTNPDIVTYNTVLSAWSHSGDETAAPQTEKIVQEMQTAGQESDNAPAPNAVTYNTVLNAWAKSTLPGAAPRASKVLEYMIKSGREEIAPNVISFTSVLDAWAKSKEPHKSVRCRELLDQLLTMYSETNKPDLRPTQIPYNSVLNACAFSAIGTSFEEQREALQIAVSTFSAMWKSNVSPDTVTYGNMLKCLANLMPQGSVRSTMALQIFQKCCGEGLVGGLAWNEVRRAVPSKDLEAALRLKGSCGSKQLKDLPTSWRKQNRFDKKAPKDRRRSKQREPPTPKARTTIIETSFQSGKDM